MMPTVEKPSTMFASVIMTPITRIQIYLSSFFSGCFSERIQNTSPRIIRTVAMSPRIACVPMRCCPDRSAMRYACQSMPIMVTMKPIAQIISAGVFHSGYFLSLGKKGNSQGKNDGRSNHEHTNHDDPLIRRTRLRFVSFWRFLCRLTEVEARNRS